MPLLDCCPIKSLTRATAKAASARLRRLGILQKSVNWQARAETCERCPMRIIQCGKSYCGRPFLQQIQRDEAIDGCGCPTLAKAKDPAEHCPIDLAFRPAEQIDGRCTCKWCVLTTPTSQLETTDEQR